MRSFLPVGLSIVLSVACADESTDADALAEPAALPSVWRPLGPNQRFATKTLEQWAVEYKRWSYSQTSCDSPQFDQDGSMCGLYQDLASPVFFLEAAPTKAPRTQCRIPAGKAIAVPIMVYSYDNAGVEMPRTEAESEQRVVDVLDSMRDLKLRANGVDIPEVESWVVGPVRFTYMVPPEPNWYSCNGSKGVSDTVVDPSFLAGYFAIFPAPPEGKHELQYGGVATLNERDVSLDVTTRFAVGEAHE